MHKLLVVKLTDRRLTITGGWCNPPLPLMITGNLLIDLTQTAPSSCLRYNHATQFTSLSGSMFSVFSMSRYQFNCSTRDGGPSEPCAECVTDQCLTHKGRSPRRRPTRDHPPTIKLFWGELPDTVSHICHRFTAVNALSAVSRMLEIAFWGHQSLFVMRPLK